MESPTDLVLTISEDIPLFYGLIMCFCLLVIYFINRYTKEDDRDEEWFDKLMTLKLPKKLID
jgi:hypothetical protein